MAASPRRRVFSDADSLAIASHELNGPLTALKLHLESLQRKVATSSGPLQPQVLTPTLTGMERQIDRFSRLIGDLLDMSRVDGGRLDLLPDTIDLAALVREVVERESSEVVALGCDVTVHAGTPVVDRWDALRLDQAVTNLVSNAIKYGAGRPIDIHVEGQGAAAIVHVHDSGPGIPAQDQERIFERFERATGPNDPGGLGLGLYIASRIVEQHGGYLTVESAPGTGSTFTITLPV